MTLFDIRPLRQQGGFGITVSQLDQGRRSRADEPVESTKESIPEEKQDLEKVVAENLEKSIKENGGDPESLVLRFRFEAISVAPDIFAKIFEVIQSAFSASSASSKIFDKEKLKTFTLDLERCGVNDEVLSQLFKYFENDQKKTLTHLFLAGNLVTAKGLQTLLHQKDRSPPLTTDTGKNLHHLGVTANPLGGRGLDVLSEFLEINPLTNNIKILHATRIAWASQSSINALRAENSSNNSLPAKVAAAPGMITVYEAERFANATRNSTSLTTVYFKQNAIQAAVDEEIPWTKKVILEDSK